MTVEQLVKTLDARIYHLADGERAVTGGYCGDFLSFVMGRAPQDSCWFTVMTNLNVCAVATLADVAVVCICEGCEPDPELVGRAKTQGINLIGVDADVYTAAIRYAGITG